MQIRKRVFAGKVSLLILFAVSGNCFAQEKQNELDLTKQQLVPPPPPVATKPFQEDWSTPQVDRSIYAKDAPQLAERDQIPGTGFTRERYFVNWRPADPFDLYVILPKGVMKPPVILALYSYPDDTENYKNNAWCEAAVSKGYAVVGFVAAITGHRNRFRMTKEWFVLD